MFCRIQNLHISQTVDLSIASGIPFCRIQNLHISQTMQLEEVERKKFCRIQNLHISQTRMPIYIYSDCFVEFKIYISLKHDWLTEESLIVL